MLCEEFFRAPENVPAIRKQLEKLARRTGPVALMEICGTHTMAIAKTGIRSILPEEIRLLSGPGCPVCVTTASAIDAILSLAETGKVTLACYGDMLRIPGSRPGKNLLRKKAEGCPVHSVYSPMDALQIAREHPEREIVFLGVGFETTAPGTAACILEAAELGISNFSVLSMLKRTEPALRSLITAPDFAVDGFLCPGHVAAITGSDAFTFLPEDYQLPGVVSGFEAGDLLYSILQLMEMLAEKRPELRNEYTRLVHPGGNPAARKLLQRVFRHGDSDWRGLGLLPDSGYEIRPEYRPWDARHKFSFRETPAEEPEGCRCGQIIRGVQSPGSCPLFGTVCTPEQPVGPCMVSSEGSCAAHYRYSLSIPDIEEENL